MGIGDGIARVFAGNGWHVVGVDVVAAKDASIVHEFHHVDLAQADSIDRFAQTLKQRHASINCLVNNAGINAPVNQPIEQWSVDEYDLIMAVNLRAPFLMCRALRPLLVAAAAGTASIVNIASVHADATNYGTTAYAATKGGLVAMTRGLAIELGRVNIRVNAVCPGAVDTPLHRRHLADGREDTGVSVDDLVAAFSRQSIVGRVGQPKELGEAVYFLADEKRSSFVTGTSLTVDGGLLAILCS